MQRESLLFSYFQRPFPTATAPVRRSAGLIAYESIVTYTLHSSVSPAQPWPHQSARHENSYAREAFCQVAPRPLRGPRTSNFDKILTCGCVRSPNRSEPSRSCVASANTALREARRTPRFGHIWQVVAGANSGERGGLHAFYRPTESAIGVFRPPAAQLSIKSTFTKD